MSDMQKLSMPLASVEGAPVPPPRRTFVPPHIAATEGTCGDAGAPGLVRSRVLGGARLLGNPSVPRLPRLPHLFTIRRSQADALGTVGTRGRAPRICRRPLLDSGCRRRL